LTIHVRFHTTPVLIFCPTELLPGDFQRALADLHEMRFIRLVESFYRHALICTPEKENNDGEKVC